MLYAGRCIKCQRKVSLPTYTRIVMCQSCNRKLSEAKAERELARIKQEKKDERSRRKDERRTERRAADDEVDKDILSDGPEPDSGRLQAVDESERRESDDSSVADVVEDSEDTREFQRPESED